MAISFKTALKRPGGVDKDWLGRSRSLLTSVHAGFRGDTSISSLPGLVFTVHDRIEPLYLSFSAFRGVIRLLHPQERPRIGGIVIS
jgi:hypothetical protein